ncbi:hypothetical protein [Novacetimonas hansenii]|uniref:hypothetical protein n=1 Tax=Novacetimonas hansenii TaxID=436 RepID=UPI001587FFF7|nr:hypothetical protein [Novacetimonas hansenii]
MNTQVEQETAPENNPAQITLLKIREWGACADIPPLPDNHLTSFVGMALLIAMFLGTSFSHSPLLQCPDAFGPPGLRSRQSGRVGRIFAIGD